MKDGLVAVMFHSIGLQTHRWAYAHIAESPAAFAAKLKALTKAGFQSVTMAEAAAWMSASPKPPGRYVLLTFDDGYCDNWVHVFPLLQHYSMKGTIFVTPEFVDPRPIIRQQARPPVSQPKSDDSSYIGFLSWPEMREMEKSGLTEIQSHALTHTWHFSGPEIVDFWHPGAATEPGGPVWMLWNLFPEDKPFYLTKAVELEALIPYGTPIYQHRKALEAPRYHPDEPVLTERLLEGVSLNGGVEFFQREGWRQELSQIVGETRLTYPPAGQFETQEEFLIRVSHELAESKRRIETELNKSVQGICWPGGGLTEEVLALAKELGYRYFTLPGQWKNQQRNGDLTNMIPRIGSASRLRWRGYDLGEPSGLEFLWMLERTLGSRSALWLGRLATGVRLVKLLRRRSP